MFYMFSTHQPHLDSLDLDLRIHNPTMSTTPPERTDSKLDPLPKTVALHVLCDCCSRIAKKSETIEGFADGRLYGDIQHFFNNRDLSYLLKSSAAGCHLCSLLVSYSESRHLRAIEPRNDSSLECPEISVSNFYFTGNSIRFRVLIVNASSHPHSEVYGRINAAERFLDNLDDMDIKRRDKDKSGIECMASFEDQRFASEGRLKPLR